MIVTIHVIKTKELSKYATMYTYAHGKPFKRKMYTHGKERCNVYTFIIFRFNCMFVLLILF